MGVTIRTALLMGSGPFFNTQIEWMLEQIARRGVLAGLALALGVAAVLGLCYARRQRVLREFAMPRISVDEVRALMRSGALPIVIDVRSEAALQLDPRRSPGALWAELHTVADMADHLPRDREIVLYGNRPNETTAATAARILFELGLRRARPLAGGLEAWFAANREDEAHAAVAKWA